MSDLFMYASHKALHTEGIQVRSTIKASQEGFNCQKIHKCIQTHT